MSYTELQSSFRKVEGKILSRLSDFNHFTVKLTKIANNANYMGLGKNAGQDIGYWQSEYDKRETNTSSLLSHMKDIEDSMNNMTDNPNIILSEVQKTFLTRCLKVRRELLLEYNKSCQICTNSLNRLKLFQGSENIKSMEEGNANNAENNLLREQEILEQSISQVDDNIRMANDSKSSLTRQREIITGSIFKLKHVVDKFPSIGSVMDQINRYHHRDSLIMAFVIAICMFLIFLYVINK